MKRLFVVAASVAVLAAAGASGAFAGEVKGPPGTPGVAGSAGEPTAAPTNSNSICSYSGLNDMKNGPLDNITQTPGNQGPPGAPGHGTCAGGSNPNRDK